MSVRPFAIISACLLALNFLAATVSAAADDKRDAPIRFLTLADIHFDPFIYCQEERPCSLIDRLRQAPVSEWPKILSKYKAKPPQYKNDTNYQLLKSSLAAAKKAAEEKHAQFVIVLGDFIGHSFKYNYPFYSQDKDGFGYQAFIKKNLEFLANELAETFPNLDVYSVVGNNDSYVDDYVSHPHGIFFKDAASIFSGLIKNKNNRAMMQQAFPVGGYYAVNLPDQPSLRLIVLNTVMFSDRAEGKGVEQGANQQLDWLHNELESVKAKHQKALIAMHIPMGIDVYISPQFRLFTLIEFWEPRYTQRFKIELQQFSPEIAAIFTGHLHSDWFQTLKVSNSNDIPVTSTPSISPIFGNNPGFKIYSYSLQSQQLEDFLTYYYPISDKRAWGMEYDFNQAYHPNCHACPILRDRDLLQPICSFTEYYKKFYAISTTNQLVIARWNPYYWCAIRGISTFGYGECSN